MHESGCSDCSSALLEAEKISLRTLLGKHKEARKSCGSSANHGYHRAGAMNHDVAECSGIARHGSMPACQKIAVAEYKTGRHWRPACWACLEVISLRESRLSVREFLGRPSPPQPRSVWSIRIKRLLRNAMFDLKHFLRGNPKVTATLCARCSQPATHLIGTDDRRQHVQVCGVCIEIAAKETGYAFMVKVANEGTPGLLSTQANTHENLH
jgi:hypothetical protein